MNKFIAITTVLLLVFFFQCMQQKTANRLIDIQKELSDAQLQIDTFKDKKGRSVAKIEALEDDISTYKRIEKVDKAIIKRLQAEVKPNDNTAVVANIETKIKDTSTTIVSSTNINLNLSDKYKDRFELPIYQAIFLNKWYAVLVKMQSDSSFLDLTIFSEPTIKTSFEKNGRFGKKRIIATYRDNNPFVKVKDMAAFSISESEFISKWNYGVMARMEWQGDRFQDMIGLYGEKNFFNNILILRLSAGKSFLTDDGVGGVETYINLNKIIND